jgi:hypothetical protein
MNLPIGFWSRGFGGSLQAMVMLNSPAMRPNIAPPQVNKSLPIRAKLSLVLLEIGTISSNIGL